MAELKRRLTSVEQGLAGVRRDMAEHYGDQVADRGMLDIFNERLPALSAGWRSRKADAKAQD